MQHLCLCHIYIYYAQKEYHHIFHRILLVFLAFPSRRVINALSPLYYHLHISSSKYPRLARPQQPHPQSEQGSFADNGTVVVTATAAVLAVRGDVSAGASPSAPSEDGGDVGLPPAGGMPAKPGGLLDDGRDGGSRSGRHRKAGVLHASAAADEKDDDASWRPPPANADGGVAAAAIADGDVGLEFIFVVGLEGTGHNFMSEIVQASPHWNVTRALGIAPGPLDTLLCDGGGPVERPLHGDDEVHEAKGPGGG